MDAAREEVGLLEAGSEFLYTYWHQPLAGLRGFALICSPLHRDGLTNYRREVALARRLAEHGVSVVRFHYRGTGNSSGDPSRLTLASMGEDAVAVASRYAQPGLPSVVVGSRLGAVPALAVSRHLDRPHLVLWDPIVSVSGYLKALSRARRVYVLAEGAAAKDPKRVMERGEPVDMLGDLLYPAFYQHVADGGEPVPVEDALVLQTGGRSGSRYLEQVRQKVVGVVEVQLLDEEEEWVLAHDDTAPDEQREVSRRMVELTAAWVLQQLGVVT